MSKTTVKLYVDIDGFLDYKMGNWVVGTVESTKYRNIVLNVPIKNVLATNKINSRLEMVIQDRFSENLNKTNILTLANKLEEELGCSLGFYHLKMEELSIENLNKVIEVAINEQTASFKVTTGFEDFVLSIDTDDKNRKSFRLATEVE